MGVVFSKMSLSGAALYVRKYFNELEAKETIEKMFSDIRLQFINTINKVCLFFDHYINSFISLFTKEEFTCFKINFI